MFGMYQIYPSRINIMGVPIDPFTMEETVERACEYADKKEFAHLIGVNADKYLQMIDSPEMDHIVRNCEIVNADGASMLLAARKLGFQIPERVAGIDLMYEICKACAQNGCSVFLLGAQQHVVEETKDALRALYPEINVVGVRNGYFTEEQFGEVASELARIQPDFVFVGITSPKKERLIEYFRASGLKGVYVGVGGSFDVVSGNIPRAPKWMQAIKCEWFFRLLQEPKRLFKRYLVGNTRFLYHIHLARRDQKSRS